MNFFKTERLVNGSEAVEGIYEAAELLGLDVIKLLDKKGGRAISGVSGFEIPAFSQDSSGRGRRVATIDKGGIVYFYPDKNGDKWGFCLDTDHNRLIVASHYSGVTLKPADQKMINEIEELCIENGMSLTPTAAVNPYLPVSGNLKYEESRKNELEAEASVLERKLEKMRKELEEAELAIKGKKAHADTYHEYTVTERTALQDGSVVDKEIEAVTENILNAPERKKRVIKSSKPLARVTTRGK